MRKFICAGLIALACLSIASGTALAQSPKGTDPLSSLPSDARALGGYNVLIADRGNDRLLFVSPAKTILWSYDFIGLHPNVGADDAFFIEGGKRIIASLEHAQVIQIIDVATKQVVWEYGELGKRGSA